MAAALALAQLGAVGWAAAVSPSRRTEGAKAGSKDLMHSTWWWTTWWAATWWEAARWWGNCPRRTPEWFSGVW